ncbi:MAG: GxxExxY protein [Acidobacteriota bacterium]|nr:MAG: GxxExxY protein [Acidobacteriota bacterium]
MLREPDDEVNLLSNRVIGIAIDIHRALGPGYIESVYENALCKEFDLQGIPFVNQHPVEVIYKGSMVGEGRLDFLVDRKLILEIKAVGSLAPVHFTQLRSYLKATGLDLGLLINFNETRLGDGIRRVVFTSRSSE